MLLSVFAPPQPVATEAPPPVAADSAHASGTQHVPRPGRRGASVAASLLAVLVVASVSGLATGLNVGGSPHYESDEGTYVASAWSMFEQGKLSYYTYNYDHPPLGWFVIGLWAKAVGGFMALGTSITTARVLMVVATVASSLLIYAIVRRATASRAAGICAAVVFAVSPLATALHRQVWLDNLATFWLLASLYLVLGARRSLNATFFSAVTFGLSFWTKEVMAVFLPAMVLLVAVAAHRLHRRFALALWLATALGMISLFVLLALLKDELLPPGVLWSSPVPHVSLVDTYSWQVSRDGAGSILSATSEFRQLFDQWWQSDPVLVVGGLVDAVIALLLFRTLPFAGAVALLAATFLVFLARGGVVLFYYVIPVLALFAVVGGLLQGYAMRMLAGIWRPLGSVAATGVLVFAAIHGVVSAQASGADFTAQPTVAQDQAKDWMIANLPRDSIILMDSYAWVELRDPSSTDGHPFTNAQYYWPGVSDPSILDGVLHDDWRTIDYLAISPSIDADIADRQLPLLPDAIKNADEVQTFYSDNWSVKILRVRKLHQTPTTADTFLTGTWDTFKAHYLQDGMVVDPKSGNTTPEAQADTLVRAVYANDQTTFEQVWQWTRGHSALETGTTGAKEDAALALLFAARRWNQPDYQAAAETLVTNIWNEDTAVVNGQRVLVSNTGESGLAAASPTDPIIAPSDFAPYAYRIFQQVDPSHPWLDLVDSSYDILGRIRNSPEFGGAAGVVPTAIALDSTTGDLRPPDSMDTNWSQFGYAASQLQWRLALDWLWFSDDRARAALQGIDLPYQQLTQTNQLLAAYGLDGQPAADYESTSVYATALSGILVAQDRNLALSVFATKVLHAYHNDGSNQYWGDLDDFDDQNWSWFATALVDGGMVNLWTGNDVLNWDQVLR